MVKTQEGTSFIGFNGCRYNAVSQQSKMNKLDIVRSKFFATPLEVSAPTSCNVVPERILADE